LSSGEALVVVVQRGGSEFYIDGVLKEQLDVVHKRVTEKDEDFFFAVDGKEGAGKSVFAMQLAKYVDPSFDMSRVCFTAKEFQDAILKAEKGEAVVFDEAFRGLSSRGALTEVNKLLIGLMMECRQKNLFVFVVLPSFFLLDKYAALWRCRGLFHVYRREGRRGFWVFFNDEKKKLLYLHGRKDYSYDHPKSHMRGRFLEQYVVDEDAYRARKKDALGKTSRSTRAEVYKAHRDLLLWVLHHEFKQSTREIASLMKDFGVELKHVAIHEAIQAKEKELRLEKVVSIPGSE
jgi:hypothetical protein